MLLKSVYLYLDDDSYSSELVVPFGFRTRYLCNFVQRRLRQLKVRAPFNVICIQGRPSPTRANLILDGRVLVTVRFDVDAYRAASKQERHEFYIGLLLEGLYKCAGEHSLPMRDIVTWIDEFRLAGYRNVWTHQTKRIPGSDLSASLLCDLDTDGFLLKLLIEQAHGPPRSIDVLRTEPDEIVFGHLFKSLDVRDGVVVVTDKVGAVVFAAPVDPDRG